LGMNFCNPLLGTWYEKVFLWTRLIINCGWSILRVSHSW
jgi:hypothetical protein